MTEYMLTCPSGHELKVLASHAGTTVICACGMQVDVPRLSQLRSNAGIGAFESGIIDTINRQIESGDLPSITQCIVSNRSTSDQIWATVKCESAWMQTSSDWNDSAWLPMKLVGLIMGFLALPIAGMLMLLSWAGTDRIASSGPRKMGHDREIEIPIRVSSEYHKELTGRFARRRLRKLLSKEPLYSSLLSEYPRLTITKVRA